MLQKRIYVTAAAIVLASCSSPNKIDRDLAGLFDKQGEYFADKTAARTLSSSEVAQMAATRDLKLVEGRVIIDNDAAFESKLDLIRSAKKEIRLVYYIYAQDNSTSILNAELIRKAQSGVKVTLLADLITNYSQLDLFSMLESEGRGNLKVYFYNYPSEQIRRDALYLTLPCPKVKSPTATQCQTEKLAALNKMGPSESTFFSRLLLAGMYGKKATALKVALSVGAQIDPADYKNEKPSEEDQKQLLEFFKIFKEATLDGDLGAKVKLSIALATYGETLNPIMNEITGRLPFGNKLVSGGSHAQEWEHLTDYTHHKLLAVDGNQFQLGGRNLEDSYHMKARVGGTGKYIFIDTDFYGRTATGGTAGIENSFDRLIKFSNMVTDLKTIQSLTESEFINNPDALLMATDACLKSPTTDIGRCIQDQAPRTPVYKDLKARMAAAKTQMNENADEYRRSYRPVLSDNWKGQRWTTGVDSLSAKDLKQAEVYYVENLPFNTNDANPKREFGSKIGVESRYSKNIHALWYRGLENACAVSANEKRDMRVVFHTAYLLMPSGLVHKLAKMMNGDYGDCSRVRVTFITNSFESTDLNVINIFARYQIKEVFQYYARVQSNFEKTQANVAPRKIPRLFPTLEYYEYLAETGVGVSLHTKLTVLGDDVLIGSANADTRSYFMDTNNGVFVRNAREFNSAYLKFVDDLIADTAKTRSMTKYFTDLSQGRIDQENTMILEGMLARWDKKGRAKEKHKTMVLNLLNGLGTRLANDTRKILDFREHVQNAQFENAKAVSELETELNKTANAMDDLFKLL